jgi:hypothetical protein
MHVQNTVACLPKITLSLSTILVILTVLKQTFEQQAFETVKVKGGNKLDNT